MSEEYCGVIGHSKDCLCDVYITEPTGWVDDAIQDMWMGQEIVNMKGYCAEWDDESILRYLQDLVFAKDNWDRFAFDKNVSIGRSNPSVMRQEIRRRLQSSDNPSIIQVLQELGLDEDGMRNVLFMGKRKMTLTELAEFEQDVLTHALPSVLAFSKKYKMTRSSVETLRSYWGVAITRTVKPRTEAELLTDRLLMERPELSNRVIAKIVADTVGAENKPSTDKVRMRRHYLKKCKRQ